MANDCARQNELDKIIETLVKESEPLLNRDRYEAVLHYSKTGEFEMAFEGLILELISVKKYPKNFNFMEFMKLAKECELDTNPSLDGFFWDSFTTWGSKYMG